MDQRSLRGDRTALFNRQRKCVPIWRSLGSHTAVHRYIPRNQEILFRLMSRIIDMRRKRFGKLVVVSMLAKAPPTAKRTKKWLCRCDCGQLHVADGAALRIGYTKSCGCLRRESSKGRMEKMNRDGQGHFITG